MSGAAGGRGDAAHARRLARAHRPRPAAAPRAACRSGSPTRACGLAIAVSMLLPWSDWEAVFGQIVDGLLDLDRGRPDDRDRRGLGDRLQRRPRSSAGLSLVSRGSGARAGPADGDHVPAAGALPHRRDARDVHARRVHARHRARRPGLLQQASTNVDQFGGGFQVRAGTSATAPIDEHAGGAAAGAGRRSVATSRCRQPVGALGEGATARQRTAG